MRAKDITMFRLQFFFSAQKVMDNFEFLEITPSPLIVLGSLPFSLKTFVFSNEF